MVTLSAVNAIPHRLYKRAATVFQKCAKLPCSTFLAVAITPDPPVPGYLCTFDVAGTLGEPIPENSILAIAFLDLTDVKNPEFIGPLFSEDICPALGCPYPAGTSFSVSANVSVPAVLPDQYAIGVGIGDPKEEAPVGCSIAIFGNTSVVPETDTILSLIV